ncbi:MAG: ATP-dependent DNA helicase RecG, partial [Rickettsiaceae bacterium]|nr:ATP-dependent DNA helicase RecG [Rickettsiaceae bacterium]
HYPQINHPEIILDQALYTDLEPKYSLTYGITNTILRSYINKLLPLSMNIPEWLPVEILQKYNLPSFYNALQELHQGGDKLRLSKSILRLKFDEAFSSQMGLKILRNKNQKLKNRTFAKNLPLQERVMLKFGYNLTEGQKDALKDIEQDQLSQTQMIRMLQGDVGCGKTIVGLLAACNVIAAKSQVVFMAPTEVLAIQHFKFICKMLETEETEVRLITSKTTTKERNILFAEIASGKVDCVIGTHAVLNEELIFKDLRFIVIDEQHKFGVLQRIAISEKGNNPDILLMSATPIPRSLSMIYFGDLAMSKISQVPNNRKKILTFVTSISKMPDIIKAISNRISINQKIYWICPLIEAKESEESDNKNDYEIIDVQKRYEYLHDIFGEKVTYLHGGIKQEKKNEIIENFRSGICPVLISTTVVEVGIDVPDATLIIIENAERFGLAQLHQLRGRVGRSDLESICILLKGSCISSVARTRLSIMKESLDGFFIAEKDLALRGEGEFFGEKQSGEQNFRFLDLAEDAYILEEISKVMNKIKIDSPAELAVSLFSKLTPDQNIIL